MRKLLTILFLCLLAYTSQAQTANAGADQTIYLTEGNTATLDGSASSGSSYQWTEVSTDYTSGATISNATSKVATVSGLPQGTFYFQITVNGSLTATTIVHVLFSPPLTGSYLRGLEFYSPTFYNYIDNRSDTNQLTGSPSTLSVNGIDYILDRCRFNSMYVDNLHGKFNTIVEDGYHWQGSTSYARTEVSYGTSGMVIDTNTVYEYDWSGYFPQDWSYLKKDQTLGVILQVHGLDGNSPPFGISALWGFDGGNTHAGRANYYGLWFTDQYNPGNNPNINDSVFYLLAPLDSLVNKTHSIRLLIKEGKGPDSFVKVYFDGVLKYQRQNHGQVGATLQEDYFKFATIYDYGQAVVNPNNHTRGRVFKLVTNNIGFYSITDTSGGGGTINPPPTIYAGDNDTTSASIDTLAATYTLAPGTTGTFYWTQTGGNNLATINTPNQSTTVIRNLVAGDYRFTVQITQSDGQIDSDYVWVHVLGVVPPPTISMAGNQTIQTDNTSTSGTVTWASGYTGTYHWTQVSGATATISSPNTASTNVTGLGYGTSVFKLTGTQDDGQTISGTVSVLVQQPATLTYSNTTQTYTGNPLSVTVTTSPSGLTGVSTTYNNSATLPVNAGTYSLKSSLSNTYYYATPITGTFTVNKASATISASNLNQTYTGSQLPITASVSPSVSGLSITYNGSSAAPTNAGTYQVIIKLTNTNYQATPDTVTYVIAKKTPTVSWSNPSAITYGTALSGTQLNATASVAGSFTYTPPSGTILNAGTQVLSVNFTPTDATNYNSVNNTTVSLTVNKATATITLSNLTQTYDGTPKPVTITTSPIGLGVITTTYNGSTTVPYAVGSYTVSSSLNNSNYTATPATGTLVISTSAASIYITNYSNLVYNGNPQTPTVTCAYSYDITYDGSATAPTNVGTYQAIATINDGIHTGADTVTMTIIKATPTITWSNPADITYGTALSGTQLNASSTVAGTFTYSPISGTVLNAGTYTLSTTFTPTDASNYNVATKTASISVNKATATITLSGLSQTYDGAPKPVTVTISPLVSGLTVTYNGSTTPATNAGSYPIVASLSNTNYTATTQTGTLVIAKVNPVLTWAQPAQITEITPLSSTQLNATSNIAGTFSYNYPTGTKFPAGTYSLVATFTPTDTTNYNGGTVSTVLIVAGNPYSDYFITNGQIFWYPLQ